MRRGDVVVVAATGNYGKPRPAVVVQTDAFPETHAFVIICQMTNELVDAPDFRIDIEADPRNGLREPSQIMVDKPVTVRRERIGQVIGHLDPNEIAKLDAAIALVMGLAD
ncbi:MAG: type II toxin-antitoxin system PemK/MazF family toxin [Azospirillaceae bacterium]|nr:type II toxin-antitoxin system PemK/MazF family toxin [Azospirillaceae bacterium]